MTRARLLGLIWCIWLVLPDVAPAATVSLQGLGGLGVGTYTSNATAVSADGMVIVGSISSPGVPRQAFRWSRDAGMAALGHLPGVASGVGASAVSADGSTVVGEDGPFPPKAFRWTASGGLVDLGDLPGGDTATSAQGASADGSIVVGASSTASGLVAFRWTAAGGIWGLGDLPGGADSSFANAVSADGLVIVGNSSSAEGTQAFRWTAASGMVGLGDLAGGSFESSALAVSADGLVIVGNGMSGLGKEAVRWTLGGGALGLGDLQGGAFSSIARGVSADGSVIVGDGTGPAGQEAFLWTASTGMVSLKDLLMSHGASEVSGWRLTVGKAISADGWTVVGTGISPSGRIEAWIATVPEPPTVAMVVMAVCGLATWRLVDHMSVPTRRSQTTLACRRRPRDLHSRFARRGSAARIPIDLLAVRVVAAV